MASNRPFGQARCFHGVPEAVTRCVHVCCGYPADLDVEDNPKAGREAYFVIADGLEAALVDVISIEDAHRHNDVGLLERFATTRVALGVVGIARTRIEPVDEIVARLEEALGSRLNQPTILRRRRAPQRRGSCGRACRIGLRCGESL